MDVENPDFSTPQNTNSECQQYKGSFKLLYIETLFFFPTSNISDISAQSSPMYGPMVDRESTETMMPPLNCVVAFSPGRLVTHGSTV